MSDLPPLSLRVPRTPAVPLLQLGWKCAMRCLGPLSRTSCDFSFVSHVQLSSHAWASGITGTGGCCAGCCSCCWASEEELADCN